MWKLANKFAKSVLPGVLKPLHVLWNEMIGFVFLMFAVVGGFNSYRYARAVEDNPDNFWRLLLAGGFSLVMGFFAVTSFLKARVIRKG